MASCSLEVNLQRPRILFLHWAATHTYLPEDTRHSYFGLYFFFFLVSVLAFANKDLCFTVVGA